jgi:uncharacterized UBP type Zn finger protein
MQRSQDASEYFRHVLKQLEQHRVALARDPSKEFAFGVESRLECLASHAVRYTHRSDIGLAVPLDVAAMATNAAAVAAFQQRQAALEADATARGDKVRVLCMEGVCSGVYLWRQS